MNEKTGKNNPCYCIRLRRAAKNLTAYYDRALAGCGITINQFALMRNIEKLGECSAVELAARVRQSKSTLARTLRPLLEEGLISDLAAPGKKSRRLRVSEKGKAVLDEAKRVWSKVQDDIAAKMGDDRASLLLEMLEQLEEIIC